DERHPILPSDACLERADCLCLGWIPNPKEYYPKPKYLIALQHKDHLVVSQPKKLIEIAMPTKEISAESVRDKSIRHGHISTLHLWWARRPLPVCRAVVFASLVPDPLDENCPKAFRDAVELILGKHADQADFYSPYKDIPWTSAKD